MDEDEQSLQTLDGIGSTYAERLLDAGITTVTHLAAADLADSPIDLISMNHE